MLVRDKQLGMMVEVTDKECVYRKCYQGHPNYGNFKKGQGYTTRNKGKMTGVCITRENFGCPSVRGGVNE